MNTFNNLKVGTKIVVGFVIMLGLMTVIGGVALFQITQIKATVTDLADNLAKDQHLSDQMVARILLARFYANKYIRGQNPDDLNRFNEEFANFKELLAQADQEITKNERVKMLTSIKAGVQDYGNHFAQVTQLMDKRRKTLLEVLDVQGPMAENQLQQLRESAFQAKDATASFYAGHAQRALLLMRLDAFKYLDQGDTQWVQKFEKRYQEAQAAFKKLDEELQDATRRQLAQKAQAAVNRYHKSFSGLQADYVQQNQAIESQLNVIGPLVRKTASEMSASVSADFDEANQATQALVAQTWTGLLITMIIATLVGLGLGFAISRSLTLPLATVIKMTDKMSVGNMNQMVEMKSSRDIDQITARQDEMGDIGRAFYALAGYFKIVIEDIVQVSQGLAEGRLRVTPKAEYRGDFLQIKKALEIALSDLGQVIKDIVQLSQGLAEGKQNVMAQAEYRGDFVQIKNALETAATKLAEATAKNALQDWLKTGQTQLNEQMSGEQDVITLAKNIITFLTTYLKAQVGVFYLLEGERSKVPGERKREQGATEKGALSDSVRLKLIASYAYSQRKGLPNEYKIGEGLIGQAALEQETLLVTEVPEDYIYIQSGIGEAVPNNILVIPFLSENAVKGVIEIGSFHEITEVQLEFLKQLMPSIGIAVNTADSRTQMQELLQKTHSI
ncbi:MAG: hypothetical protein DRR08_01080 [Candidatus Parabeggiatoa sp. nov. 2]|nr:MAG: hypothetical protein B6247_03075 [Beggiatoa sp. 4572_84]RKZ64308.1 MAG: hypothetical protein DRR08_01080 [Gammaproteobacteria bacterium]